MRAPSFWNRKGAVALLLAPLGKLYGASVAFKAAHASPYRAPMPVICVGNLTAGGTGKTPVAIAIAEALKARGRKPIFLTRGYGGKTAAPLLVKPHHGARVVGDEPGFLLESVEHGERWSRWSFIGRSPLATLTARGRAVEAAGTLPEGIPLDQGILAAIEAVLAAWRAPVLEDLPPLHGGLLGYLGYDVVREVEHLPDVPHDDLGHPDAVVSVIGQLAAYDHWRQRVVAC